MIAQELEVSLHMAFVEACQQRHEFITVSTCCWHCLITQRRRRCCALRPTSTTCVIAVQFHQRQHAPGGRHRRGGHPAHAGLPARHPAPSCTCSPPATARRKSPAPTCWWRSSARKTCTPCIPAPAGRDPPGCGELHRPRHQAGEPSPRCRSGRPEESRSRKKERRREGGAAGAVHGQPEPGRQGRQDRSADRARLRGERARSRSRAAAARTTRCWWVRPAWARPRSPKGWLAHHRERMCRDPGRGHGVFARHGRLLAGTGTAAISSSAERKAVLKQLETIPTPSCSSTRSTPDRCGARRGHAGRVQPAEAGAVQRAAQSASARPPFTEYRGIFERDRRCRAVPEDRRGRTDGARPSRS